MGYGDYYWGLYRDYYRDPFPHSLLSARENWQSMSCGGKALDLDLLVWLQEEVRSLRVLWSSKGVRLMDKILHYPL